MGYTHKWVPPSAAYGNNLTAWKTICQDIHTQLLASGLDAASDTGQLDITAVGALPSFGGWAGYKMYTFDDGLTPAIFIKLEFGLGTDGLHDGGYGAHKMIRIRVTIGSATDGAGGITGNSVQYQCPQSYNAPDGTNYLTSLIAGYSMLCYNQDRGFLGLYYQVAGRPSVVYDGNKYGGYVGATLVINIQRLYDADGTVNSDGYMVLYPDLATADGNNPTWTFGNMTQSKAKIIHADNSITQATSQISRTLTHPYQGNISCDHPYAFDDLNGVVEMSCVGVSKLNAISIAQEFDLELAPSITQHMISVGRETSMSFYPTKGQEHCAFMLWE